MTYFLSSFRLAFALSALAGFLLMHFVWSSHALPPPPPFPLARADYVSTYGDVGYVVHSLYRFGIFGMRDRMQRADLLLLGPSHVELGLSAVQLSADLTSALHRPVNVYNLSQGYGDSLPFTIDVLTANHIRDKAALADLYMGNGPHLSAFARQAEQGSRLSAYLKVTNLWLHAAQDWLLDPLLPRLRPALAGNGAIRLNPERMLQTVVTRNWASGDTVRIWRPATGDIYVDSPPAWRLPFHASGPEQQAFASCVILTPQMQADLRGRGIRLVYTLVPYPTYLPHQVPPNAQPYLPLPADGLTFIDSNHLNAASREKVTASLYESLEKSVDLQSWIFPNGHPEQR